MKSLVVLARRTTHRPLVVVNAHSLKGGLEITVIGMVAEEGQVAAEICLHAELTDGRLYENQYHMLFTLRQGKIVELREDAHTLLIAHLFG